MKMTKLALVPELPNGTKLECVEGRLIDIGPMKSGGEGDKAWTMQIVQIKDGSGEMHLQVWGQPEIKKTSKNDTIRIVCGTDKNDKPCGIITDEYKDKPRIKVTESAKIEWPDAQQEHTARSERREEPRQQQRQNEPEPQEPRQQRGMTGQEATDGARRVLAQVATAYTMCYDAAAVTAWSIFERHGQIVSSGAIGIMADKYMIELGRRGWIDRLPPQNPLTMKLKGRPISELCSLLGEAAIEQEVKKAVATRAATPANGTAGPANAAPPAQKEQQPEPPATDRGWPSEEALRAGDKEEHARHPGGPVSDGLDNDDIPF